MIFNPLLISSFLFTAAALALPQARRSKLLHRPKFLHHASNSTHHNTTNADSYSIWIGIDGDSCKSALFQTGVTITIDKYGTHYEAWYEWFPDYAVDYTGVSVSPGDVVKLDIGVLSPTIGLAGIENLSNGQSAAMEVLSPYPLCGQDVEWIVERPTIDGRILLLPDFNEVTFTDARTSHGSEIYTPRNSKHSLMDLTAVSVKGDDLKVTYI